MQSVKFTLLSLIITFAVSASAQTASLQINEICPSNIDQWVDPSFNYGGWVELYNPTSTAVNITGWYLSDNKDKLKDNPKKLVVRAEVQLEILLLVNLEGWLVNNYVPFK